MITFIAEFKEKYHVQCYKTMVHGINKRKKRNTHQ
jgi:hypothetical protein